MTDKERIRKAFESLSVPVQEGSDYLKVETHKRIGKGRRVTVVFLGSDIEMTEASAAVKAMALRGWQVTVAASEAALALLDVPNLAKSMGAERLIALKGMTLEVLTGLKVKNIPELIQESDAWILPNLTQSTAAKVSVGIQDDAPSLLLWYALTQNKPVVAGQASLFDGWIPLDGNKAMAAVVKKHVETLTGFGVKWASGHDYEAVLCQIGLGPTLTEETKVSVLPSTVKVITEQTLKTWNGKVLRIPKGVKVTPSARDFAKVKGIELIQL